MRVVFLCAGYGTRLYPLTENQPKPLLNIGGKALLTHILHKIEKLSLVDSVTLVTNNRFYGHFCDWQKSVTTDLSVFVMNDGTNDPEHRLGAIQDLRLSLSQTKMSSDVLVIAGDNLFDASLNSFVSFAREKKPGASIGVYDVKDRGLAQKYGLIKADSSGRITAFFEKPKDPPTTLASMGVYYFPEETLPLIDRYLEANRNPDAPGYYISWLSKETDVFACPFPGAWFD
ncbi:MAG: nucleotidyltransferase family protein, partial [Candidatus Omnitrophica bacterium]|nr:nucleotidyltransferase family protein [Candidatus Omnitrophota bacterium]